MSALEVFTQLRIDGLTLWTTPADELQAGPAPLSDEHRAAIRSCRDELFAVVRQEEEMIKAAETVAARPCPRCGSTGHKHTVLWHEPHVGRSVSRECATCNHSLCLPVWYGEIGERPASEQTPAASLAVDELDPPADSLKPAEPDQGEILRALTIVAPTGVAELRILGAGRYGTGVDAGYFDEQHRPAMAKWAATYSKSGAKGVYVPLNPIRPELLARAVNRMQERCRTNLHDAEVVARRWLPVDVDHHRPAGISASREEIAKAFRVGSLVRRFLADAGWPEPLVAFSGNGLHLLYRIDLPNDDPSRDLVRDCLYALAQRFDADDVKVDRSTFNAARIWKLYGTVARKGDSTLDRPHRRATILACPESFGVVDHAQLAALAAEVKKPERKATDRPRPLAGKRKDVFERAAKYVATVDPAVSGQGGHNTTYRLACALVKGFGLKPEESLVLMLTWNQKCQPPWTDKELVHKVNSADRSRDERPRGYLLDEESQL